MSQEQLIQILLSPHVSEKSTKATDQAGQYVFKVIKSATKPQIKRAVEVMFNVKVGAVQVSNVKAKAKRSGRFEGHRKGWKKAYVSLQAGQKIDFTGAQA